MDKTFDPPAVEARIASRWDAALRAMWQRWCDVNHSVEETSA